MSENMKLNVLYGWTVCMILGVSTLIYIQPDKNNHLTLDVEPEQEVIEKQAQDQIIYENNDNTVKYLQGEQDFVLRESQDAEKDEKWAQHHGTSSVYQRRRQDLPRAEAATIRENFEFTYWRAPPSEYQGRLINLPGGKEEDKDIDGYGHNSKPTESQSSEEDEEDTEEHESLSTESDNEAKDGNADQFLLGMQIMFWVCLLSVGCLCCSCCLSKLWTSCCQRYNAGDVNAEVWRQFDNNVNWVRALVARLGRSKAEIAKNMLLSESSTTERASESLDERSSIEPANVNDKTDSTERICKCCRNTAMFCLAVFFVCMAILFCFGWEFLLHRLAWGFCKTVCVYILHFERSMRLMFGIGIDRSLPQ